MRAQFTLPYCQFRPSHTPNIIWGCPPLAGPAHMIWNSFLSHVHATLQPALSVGRLVRHILLFLWFYFFDLTAPAQMVWWLRKPCIRPCFFTTSDLFFPYKWKNKERNQNIRVVIPFNHLIRGEKGRWPLDFFSMRHLACTFVHRKIVSSDSFTSWKAGPWKFMYAVWKSFGRSVVYCRLFTVSVFAGF